LKSKDLHWWVADQHQNCGTGKLSVKIPLRVKAQRWDFTYTAIHGIPPCGIREPLFFNPGRSVDVGLVFFTRHNLIASEAAPLREIKIVTIPSLSLRNSAHVIRYYNMKTTSITTVQPNGSLE
jgi:hypothetical protein